MKCQNCGKEYIKMCEKAGEIQGLWKPKIADMVWRGKGYLRIPDACGYLTETPPIDKKKKIVEIWLPRQGQLQEMVRNNWKSEYSLYFLTMFIRWWKYYDEKYIVKFKSMEQLWLAFVMKEKFNKVWNGEDWIKEGLSDE